MAARRQHVGASALASRWRRRRMCVLIAGVPAPAALREVTANRLFLETEARPPVGSGVELHHPEAGSISGTVAALERDGIAIEFAGGEQSVGCALAAIVAPEVAAETAPEPAKA